MEPTVQPHHHHFRLILTTSSVVVVLVGVGLWIYYANRPKPVTPTPKKQVAETILVPQEFEDFIGSVTAVSGSDVTASFGLTDVTGTTQHSYVIHTNAKTVLQTQKSDSKGVAVFSPLKLSDITVGDKIHAYSDQALYSLNEFTALKIYLLK